jgi:hypothetical protein
LGDVIHHRARGRDDAEDPVETSTLMRPTLLVDERLQMSARLDALVAIECVFRRDPDSRSGLTRALVPAAPGQLFRRPGQPFR